MDFTILFDETTFSDPSNIYSIAICHREKKKKARRQRCIFTPCLLAPLPLADAIFNKPSSGFER